MKTKFGIVGCGFLGNIVAEAYRKGLLPCLLYTSDAADE